MMLVVYYITVTMILTKELMMATDYCEDYQFQSPFNLGNSCEEIYNMNPDSQGRSGYYWILDGPSQVFCGMTYSGSSCLNIYNGNPETVDKSGYYRINYDQWTYCNMTEIAAGFLSTCAGVGGGWRRIANIDISAGGDCPNGWLKDTNSGVSFCRVVSDSSGACSSANFSTNGTSYQRVCGRARGYQKGIPVGFFAYNFGGQMTIDGYYGDGLLITYDSPRQHIWSYTIGRHDNLTDTTFNCPCAVGGGPAPPPFVQTNYYCESGALDVQDTSAYYFNDPLWDRSGCIESHCCSSTTQPWFYYELSGITTSDIEARICSFFLFNAASPLVDQLELYIQLSMSDFKMILLLCGVMISDLSTAAAGLHL
ncbi:uncharacterized protein [Dysidea avara]|uniref:uncharacterized protein n=1 Tax=Dysidea avara TaxID=196820 RepID=UPI003326A40C